MLKKIMNVKNLCSENVMKSGMHVERRLIDEKNHVK